MHLVAGWSGGQSRQWSTLEGMPEDRLIPLFAGMVSNEHELTDKIPPECLAPT